LSTLIRHPISIPTSESFSHTSVEPKIAYGPRDKPAGPLRRLRNTIIERIWSIPSKSPRKSSLSPRPTRAPENFLARYGGDVVLRFQVKTEQEAKAISEAADIRYIDIWESTNDWVDIRIAKEVVPS